MRLAISTIIFLFVNQFVFSQSLNIHKLYGGSSDDLAVDICRTLDGGFIVVAETESNDSLVSNNYGNSDIWVIKLNHKLVVKWEKSLGGSNIDYPKKVIQTEDGSIYVVGVTHSSDGLVTQSFGEGDGWVIKLSSRGDILWQKTYGGAGRDLFNSILPLSNSELLISAGRYNPGTTPGASPWLYKIDSSGNMLWKKWYGLVGLEIIREVIETSTNELMLLATRTGNTYPSSASHGFTDVLLIKLDSDGNILWNNFYGGSNTDFAFRIIETEDNGYVIFGQTDSDDFDLPALPSGGGGLYNAWVFKVDSTGALLWSKKYGGSAPEVTHFGFHQTKDGGFIAAANSLSDDGDIGNPLGASDAWLFRLDSAGNLINEVSFGGSGMDEVVAFVLDQDENIISLGNSNSSDNDLFNVPNYGMQDIWISKLNGDSLNNATKISGFVYHDKDRDCQYVDSLDAPMSGSIIEMVRPTRRYAYTDTNGNYTFYVKERGLYRFKHVIPNFYEQLVSEQCDSILTTYLYNHPSSEIVNDSFGVKLNNCTILEAGIATYRKRLCAKNFNIISYSNRGNIEAKNFFIHVSFPQSVYPSSSSHPYAINSTGHLVFKIDSLDPGEVKYITIIDSVECDVNLIGLQGCSRVWITPSNQCYDSLGAFFPIAWDSSDISINTSCDSINSITSFSILNLGADMSEFSNYRIISERGLLFRDSLKLNKNDTMLIELVGTSNYFRVEVENTEGHPSFPTMFAETNGCPRLNSNLNLTPSFDTYNKNISSDIDCVVFSGAYDPNDKQVTPSGILAQNYVHPETLLDYKIRFQNTGNDTAYNVEIIDTLSPHLDIASLQLGTTSHPYRFDVTGSNSPVLHFKFDDIYLVDSSTNEPLSHGFVKFKIAAYDTVPENTVVENFADIYFDFNPPIRTNTPFVTLNDTVPLSDEKVTVVVDGDTVLRGTLEVSDKFVFYLYPNPNNGKEFVVDGTTSGQALRLYNLTGKLESIWSLEDGKTTIRAALTNGIHLYQITGSQQQMLQAGKLVVVQ